MVSRICTSIGVETVISLVILRLAGQTNQLSVDRRWLLSVWMMTASYKRHSQWRHMQQVRFTSSHRTWSTAKWQQRVCCLPTCKVCCISMHFGEKTTFELVGLSAVRRTRCYKSCMHIHSIITTLYSLMSQFRYMTWFPYCSTTAL